MQWQEQRSCCAVPKAGRCTENSWCRQTDFLARHPPGTLLVHWTRVEKTKQNTSQQRSPSSAPRRTPPQQGAGAANLEVQVGHQRRDLLFPRACSPAPVQPAPRAQHRCDSSSSVPPVLLFAGLSSRLENACRDFTSLRDSPQIPENPL